MTVERRCPDLLLLIDDRGRPMELQCGRLVVTAKGTKVEHIHHARELDLEVPGCELMQQYTRGDYDPFAPNLDEQRRYFLMTYLDGPKAGLTAIWGWHLPEQIPDRLSAPHRGALCRYQREDRDYRYIGEGSWPEVEDIPVAPLQ